MRIDALKTTPDRAGRYWLTLENGDKLALYRQTVEDFALYAGKELSDAEFSALREAIGKMSAKMRAVRIVSATNVSKRDLEQRLVRKGEDPEKAHEAVEWMQELHLIDDKNTAESIVSSCIAKGYGVQRAKQALYEKRIPKELWDDALADYPDQTERITQFLRARIDENSDARDIKRAVDALLRRGHSYGDIRRALNTVTSDSDGFMED